MKKKLLLSAIGMCMIATMLAQSPETGKYYRIRNAEYGTVIRESWTNNQLSCNDVDTTDYSQLWLYTENQALKNVFTGKYIQPQPTLSARFTTGTSAESVNFELIENEELTIAINGNNLHCSSSQGNSVVKWHADANASHWVMDEVTISEDSVQAAHEEYQSLLEQIQFPESGKYYRIRSASYGTVIKENWAESTLSCKTTDADDYAQVWLFTNDNAFQNVYTGKYMQPQATQSAIFTTNTTSQRVTFVPTEDGELTIAINGHNLHCSQSQGNSVVKWNASADASHWIVDEVTVSEGAAQEARNEYETLSGLVENAPTYTETLKTFFTNELCTELKSEYAGLSNEELKDTMAKAGLPTVLQDIAVKVKNDWWNLTDSTEYADVNRYAEEFRSATYKPYSDANAWRNKLKSSSPNFMGNPTGIYADYNEVLHVFVGNDIPENATLYLTPTSGNARITSRSQGTQLQKGYNVVVAPDDGLHYFVNYVVNTLDDEGNIIAAINDFHAMNIHIEGGDCIGYYQKPEESSTEEDEKFQYLTSEAPQDKFFMVKGETTLFLFPAQTFVNVWPETIWNSINWFDRVQYWQFGLIGILDKVAEGLCESGTEHSRSEYEFNITGGDAFYPTYCNNPSLAVQGASNTNPFATTFYTNYPGEWGVESSFNAERPNFDNWCCGHEHGHHIQGAYNLESCTESSVNLGSQLIQYMTGYRVSRGWNFAQNYAYVAQGTPFGLRSISITMRMYWNLYLYYHIAGNKKDFYPTFVKSLREDPMDFTADATKHNAELNKSAGHHRATNTWIKLYKKACDAAQEDLTEYFRLWGFFEPCDTVWFGDYTNYWVSLSQAEIDSAIAEVKAKNYPENLQIMFIEDRQILRPRTDIWASSAPENQKYKPDSDGTWRTQDEMQNLYGNIGDVLTYIDGSANTSEYEYILNNNNVNMIGKGGVGFIVYDNQDSIRFMSNSFGFAIPEELVTEGFEIKVMNADGSTSVATRTEMQEGAQFDSKKLFRVYSSSRNRGYKSWAVNDAATKATLENYNPTKADQVWQFIEGTGENAGKYLIYNVSTGKYMEGVAGNIGVALTNDVESAKYYTKQDNTENGSRYAFNWSENIKNWLYYDNSDNLFGWVDSGHEYFCLEEATIYLDENAPSYTQPWTMGNNPSPWLPDAIDNPTELDIPNNSTVRYAEANVHAPEGTITVNFLYNGGNHKLAMLGVDLLDENGEVVESDYHNGFTGYLKSDNTYTVNVPSAGTYKLRYIVNNIPGDAELTQTQGIITVTYSADGNVSNSRIFNNDNATGISTLEAEDATKGNIYDLSGRKLNEAGKRGIYIVGDKVVIK